MKRLLLIIALCVVTQGQSKDPISRLNAESSATWGRVAQAEVIENERHQKEIDRFADLRNAMLQAAGVPAEARSHCYVESTGIVACAKPETAKAEKK